MAQKTTSKKGQEYVVRINKYLQAFGGHHSIKLVPGTEWQRNVETHEIHVPIEELVSKKFSQQAILGASLHELGHGYSRPFVSFGPSHELLRNGIEDIRIERIQSMRFEGGKHLFKAATQEWIPTSESALASLTRAEQFYLAHRFEWLSGKKITAPLDPAVKVALDKTRRYVEEATRLPEGVDLRFHDLTKEEADRESARSEKIVNEKIWPIFRQLVEADASDPKTEQKLANRSSKGKDKGDRKGREGSPSGGGGEGSSSPDPQSASEEKEQHAEQTASRQERNESGAREGSRDIEMGNDREASDRRATISSSQKDPLTERTDDIAHNRMAEQLADHFGRIAKELAGKTEPVKGTTGGTTGQVVDGRKGSPGQAGSQEHTSGGGNSASESAALDGHRKSTDRNERDGEGSTGKLTYSGNDSYSLEDELRRLRTGIQRKHGSSEEYEAIQRELKRFIDPTAKRIQAALDRDELPELDGYHTDGQVFDTERASDEKFRRKHTGQRGDGKVYLRTEEPEDQSTAAALVVDISGSMKGKGIEAARKVFVLFQEMMAKARLPYAFITYNEKPKLRLALGQHALGARQGALEHLVADGENNETGALKLAGDELKRSRAARKLIFVITDGISVTDTAAYAAKMEKRGFTVIGIGVGPQGAAVKQVFPKHHIHMLELEKLPDEVAKLIEEIVLGKR